MLLLLLLLLLEDESADTLLWGLLPAPRLLQSSLERDVLVVGDLLHAVEPLSMPLPLSMPFAVEHAVEHGVGVGGSRGDDLVLPVRPLTNLDDIGEVLAEKRTKVDFLARPLGLPLLALSGVYWESSILSACVRGLR